MNSAAPRTFMTKQTEACPVCMARVEDLERALVKARSFDPRQKPYAFAEDESEASLIERIAALRKRATYEAAVMMWPCTRSSSCAARTGGGTRYGSSTTSSRRSRRSRERPRDGHGCIPLRIDLLLLTTRVAPSVVSILF